MEYRKEIDGLRAIAVIAVILYHFRIFSFPGGFWGVDVFFVISGYLISNLLLEEVSRTGTINLSNFYLRRTRRILPALVTTCAVTAIPFFVLLKNSNVLKTYVQSIYAAIFSVANIFFYFKTSYFTSDKISFPLLHTWSLGVEEQFYIIFPILIIAIARWKGRFTLKIWCILSALSAFSLFSRPYLVSIAGDSYDFYILTARMWQFIAGTLVALLLKRVRLTTPDAIRLCNVASFVALASLITGFYTKYDFLLYGKGIAVTASAALLILCTHKHTLVGKLLSTPPLRFIGLISYSLYLWHWPIWCFEEILRLVHGTPNSLVIKAALLAVTVLVSTLSWRFIEQPFRVNKYTWKQSIQRIGPVFALLMLSPAALLFGNPAKVMTAEEIRVQTISEHLLEGTTFMIGDGNSPPTFVVLGDSHAERLTVLLNQLANEYGTRGKVFVKGGTVPFTDLQIADSLPSYQKKTQFIETAFRWIKENDIRFVLIPCRWNYYLFGTTPELNSNYGLEETSPFYANGKPIRKTTAALFASSFRQMLGKLNKLGCAVWIVEQVPAFPSDPSFVVELTGRAFDADASYHKKRTQTFRDAITGLIGGDVHYIETDSYFERDGRWHSSDGDTLLYKDDDHLSSAGSLHLRDAVLPFFKSMTDPAETPTRP